MSDKRSNRIINTNNHDIHVTEPTLTHPHQFTMSNSYVIPPPSFMHHNIRSHTNADFNPYISSPMPEPLHAFTIANAACIYNPIYIPYIPYTITDAPSINPSAISSSNKNVTHKRKREFQSALNTEKLHTIRQARQDDRLRLRRSDRENRLQQKRKSITNYNHKRNNNDKKPKHNRSKAETKLNDTSNNGKYFSKYNNKEERTTQQLLLNINKKRTNSSQKKDNKYRKLRKSKSHTFHICYPEVDESRRKEEFPSLQEIDELKDGEYFVYGKQVIVRCNYKEKDGYLIGFCCPFCFDKYKKNGQPYKRAKPSHHFHGAGCENIKNGAMGSCGTRVPHCSCVYQNGHQYKMAPLGYEFHLYVTPSTKVVAKRK